MLPVDSNTAGSVFFLTASVLSLIGFVFLAHRFISFYTRDHPEIRHLSQKQKLMFLYGGVFLSFTAMLLTALACYIAGQYFHLVSLDTATTQQHRSVQNLGVFTALGLAWNCFGIMVCSPTLQVDNASKHH